MRQKTGHGRRRHLSPRSARPCRGLNHSLPTGCLMNVGLTEVGFTRIVLQAQNLSPKSRQIRGRFSMATRPFSRSPLCGSTTRNRENASSPPRYVPKYRRISGEPWGGEACRKAIFFRARFPSARLGQALACLTLSAIRRFFAPVYPGAEMPGFYKFAQNDGRTARNDARGFLGTLLMASQC